MTAANRATEDVSQAQVVVVGGGVAGLTAALSLAEAGLAPLLLEADPQRCGGRFSARDPVEFSYQGQQWRFPAEHGVHGLWAHYFNLRALLDRYDVHSGLLAAERQEWIYGRGESVTRAEVTQQLRRTPLPAPFHYLALLARPGFLSMFNPLDLLRLPWVGLTILAMLALDPARDGDALAGRSVRYLTGFWPAGLRAFAGALARSGLASGVEDASLAGFVALFRFYSLLRKDAIGYQYLRGDPGSLIIDPLQTAVGRLGGAVQLGTTVTRVEAEEEKGWRIYWRPTAAGGEERCIRARFVVLATDAPAARSILTSSETTRAEASHLRWSEGQPSAIVRFWYAVNPRPGVDGGMFGGYFFLDNFFWLHRIQEPFVQWHLATGGSAVEAHIYAAPDVLSQPAAVLLAMAASDLGRAFPELRGTVVHSSIQRNPATHTLLSLGTTSRHLGVETPWSGLFCCGDWVRHETPSLFLERACVTGLAAANAVRAQLGLATAPPLPHPGPEPLAALLQGGLRGVIKALRWATQRTHAELMIHCV